MGGYKYKLKMFSYWLVFMTGHTLFFQWLDYSPISNAAGAIILLGLVGIAIAND